MLLFCGAHPNVSFYLWRLSQGSPGDIRLYDVVDTASKAWSWSGPQFKPSKCLPVKIKDLSPQNGTFETIFLSAQSLQELATLCNELGALIKYQAQKVNVVIESTNFVNLEPFVRMSMQLGDDIDPLVSIISVMSDYDVRSLDNENFEVYPSKKESELIYVGRSGMEKSYSNQDVEVINDIATLFEASGLDVYKLNTPLEFLSYQWKFALPKIAIEPLSVLFEKPFPQDLSDQILAKPLISGLILEVITVIKTMGCKLFNSYDNETSLLNRLSQLSPPVELSKDKREAPRLYYDFFNQQPLYLDLLLLQPILIADDNQVKTPYLEFLYAIMSQVSNYNNSSWGDINSSEFWIRKSEVNNVLAEQKKQFSSNDEVKLLKRELEAAKQQLNQMKNAASNSALKQKQQISIQQQQQQQQQQQIAAQQPQMPPQQQAAPVMVSPPVNHSARYEANGMTHTQRSSTDPQIDPEMEELSELAASYDITQQTPQLGRPFDAPAQPVEKTREINGRSSPQFSYQQNIPHGLPSQGLPQGYGVPGMSGMSRMSSNGNLAGVYNGGAPPPPPPNGMPFNGMPSQGAYNGVPPQGAYNSVPPQGAYNSVPPPGPYNTNMNGSRRSLQQGPSGMGAEYGSNTRYDTSFGSMPGGGNRAPSVYSMGPSTNMAPNGFKPANRKNNRMSQNLMAQQMNSIPGAGMGGGMPNSVGGKSRHSMMPSSSMVPGSAAQSKRRPQYPNNSSDSANGSNINLMPPSAPSAPIARSSTSENLVPVPEATPSPTPVYVTSGAEEKTTKKKRGLFKFK